MSSVVIQDSHLANVLEVRHLTESTFVVRFEKGDIQFKAGQHIALGLPDLIDTREYSIYSGENEPFVEVLIREVQEGFMSKRFKKLTSGDKVRVIKPVGYFTLLPEDIKNKKFVFIASGTGIAPFHSYVKSYPEIKYTLLHGIRHLDETYEKEHYKAENYLSCISRDAGGNFQGRVTDFLENKFSIDKNALYYLCGNYEMIDDAYSILEKAGVATQQIRAEVYF